MFQNNAEKLLESHLKFAHPIAGGSNNDNKPEKFPRPELKLDSSAEEWSEFLVPWNEYKAEYNQTALCQLLQGPSFRELWAAVRLIKQRSSCYN